MKGYPVKIIFFVCMCLICPLSVSAEVDWQAQHTINLNKSPVDTCMSVKGIYMYILTDDGVIYVYDSAGRLKGQIEVGKDINKITAGSKDNLLILTSKKSRKVQTISVDFIKTINIKGSPFKGNADAPVVIVVFTDYQCGYCGKLDPLLSQVAEKNKDTVKLVIKNFPLNMHQYAREAASAALAADSMGKFWEFHEALYKNKKFDDKSLREMATGFGLDPDEFERKMKSKEIQNRINMDKIDGQKAKVSGTPTVFINGRLTSNRSLRGFQNIIDAQLKKK